MSGYHRMNGILVMSGPDVQPGQQVSGAQIVDLAPTILYALGVPAPGSMDGKVLHEAFKADELIGLDDHVGLPERAHEDLRGETEGAYSEEEEARVQERLRELGYLAKEVWQRAGTRIGTTRDPPLHLRVGRVRLDVLPRLTWQYV